MRIGVTVFPGSNCDRDAMCRRLLSNPTVEEYEWEVVS